MRITAPATLISLALLLSACGGSNNSAALIQGDDGVIRITTDGGEATTGDNKLPEDWPSDVTQYPGSSVQYAASLDQGNNEKGLAAVFMTTDTPEQVTAFYKDKMVEDGWEITASGTTNGMMIVAATKDERVASLAVTSAEGSTSITIGIGKK